MALDFANSTSVAFRDICEMWKVRNKNERLKEQYKQGLITLEKLNEMRIKLGRPPIKAHYVRPCRVKVVEQEFMS